MVLMFTDVVNSTRIKRELGLDAYRAMVLKHDAFIGEAMATAPTGRIFQDNGDGYFAGFESISDALNAALLFQWLMHREPWPQPFSARVGLHLGQIEEMHNQATGQPRFLASAADMAARVMSAAGGGQLLLTRAVFDEARQLVRQHPAVHGATSPPTLRWVAHGPYQFKGNDEPIEVFEVGAEGIGPFTTPPDSERAKRQIRPGDELSLGWRPAAGLEIPDQPNWLIAEKLGEGGFGEVWLACHRKVQTQRVFKFCFDPERLRALKREVVLFRLLKGALGERRDIARIIDFQFEKPPYSIEMEYVPDGNLVQWAEKQGGIDKVPIQQRIDIVARIAEALSAAHSAAVLHKDMKPANILIAPTASSTRALPISGSAS
jgi:serine/threonine-protein kinase